MDIKDILNKDDVLASVEELTDVIVNDFESLDALVLIWETTEGQVCHRTYGTSTDVVGLLVKSAYIILRQTTAETIDPKEANE